MSSLAAVASSNKRNRRTQNVCDGELDDILNQVVSKMDGLSAMVSEEERREKSINIFMEVIDCHQDHANFYLESASWNIETAVVLWLENNPRENRENWGQLQDPHPGDEKQDARESQGQWLRKEVPIVGLDSDWSAKVSPSTGTIYFVHNPTGLRQKQVPPGFADREVKNNVNPVSAYSAGTQKPFTFETQKPFTFGTQKSFTRCEANFSNPFSKATATSSGSNGSSSSSSSGDDNIALHKGVTFNDNANTTSIFNNQVAVAAAATVDVAADVDAATTDTEAEGIFTMDEQDNIGMYDHVIPESSSLNFGFQQSVSSLVPP